MTNKQAIEKLNDIRCHVKETSTEEQALVMAINALEAQLSQERTDKRTESHACDLISRQAAKLKVARVVWEDGDSCYDFNDKCVDCLDDVQPEEAIPVSWIEARIAKFMMAGDAFSGLTASIIRVMLNEWKREQEGATT